MRYVESALFGKIKRKPKIANLYFAILSNCLKCWGKKESSLFLEIKKLNCLHDEDVRWLQVSMDDSQVVDKDQTIQKLSCHVERAKSPELQITLVSLEIDERGNIVEQ